MQTNQPRACHPTPNHLLYRALPLWATIPLPASLGEIADSQEQPLHPRAHWHCVSSNYPILSLLPLPHLFVPARTTIKVLSPACSGTWLTLVLLFAAPCGVWACAQLLGTIRNCLFSGRHLSGSVVLTIRNNKTYILKHSKNEWTKHTTVIMNLTNMMLSKRKQIQQCM